MKQGQLDKSRTEPAARGLRFPFFAALLLVLGACAATPEPQAEPAPMLNDRSEESTFELGEVEEKLFEAETLEADGKRGLAVLVVGTAQEMLPRTALREHAYLDVLKATMWARPGDDRDATKAKRLLEDVAYNPEFEGDARLHSEIELARVVMHLAGNETGAAARSADLALSELRKIDAWSDYVATARRLARQFLQVEDATRARDYARRALAVAERLEDERHRLQASLTAGEIELLTALTDEAGERAEAHFLDAYEAAYRIGSTGWRNVVIVTVAGVYFTVDDHEACVRWGNRIRGRDRGELPRAEESHLWTDDYLGFLAKYLFALEALDESGSRYTEAAEITLETIESLPEDEREGWNGLVEKLRADLLQRDVEK